MVDCTKTPVYVGWATWMISPVINATSNDVVPIPSLHQVVNKKDLPLSMPLLMGYIIPVFIGIIN